MDQSPEVMRAGQRLDRLQQEKAAPADVAEATLALSQALEKDDRLDEAVAADHRGIGLLSPAFLADPRALAEEMRGLVAHYLALTSRTRIGADETLLAPIAAALGGIVAAEDAAEEEGELGNGDAR